GDQRDDGEVRCRLGPVGAAVGGNDDQFRGLVEHVVDRGQAQAHISTATTGGGPQHVLLGQGARLVHGGVHVQDEHSILVDPAPSGDLGDLPPRLAEFRVGHGPGGVADDHDGGV